MTGTPIVIGFSPSTQRPIQETYLNEATAWADEAAVLAGIPIGSRSDGLTVKIGLVEYWFLADLTTLQVKSTSTLQTAAEVAITDTGTLFVAEDVEAALAEVKTQVNASDAAIAAIGTVGQYVYTILLDVANKVVATRIAGAHETADYPTGWVLTVGSTVNLLVTHTLTGRKCAAVNVFEIDGSNERLLTPFNSAYTGILCNGLTVLIEGLAPVDLGIRIEMIFK